MTQPIAKRQCSIHRLLWFVSGCQWRRCRRRPRRRLLSLSSCSFRFFLCRLIVAKRMTEQAHINSSFAGYEKYEPSIHSPTLASTFLFFILIRIVSDRITSLRRSWALFRRLPLCRWIYSVELSLSSYTINWKKKKKCEKKELIK